MKIKNILAVAALALFAGPNAYAQDAAEPVWPKIYINPGHGTFTSNDRPMSTIKHGANNAYTDANNDTTNFFESNTNLHKAFALLDQLVEYGVPFDRTKNQDTNQDRWKIGAARDLSQTNIVMSHVKAGEAPAYTDYAPVTGATKDYPNPTNGYYNRNLSEICAEVEAWGADMFISIHSNAATEGNTTNYLYFAWDNKFIDSDGNPKAGTEGATIRDLSIAMSEKGWDHRIRDRHTQWTHYDNPVGGGTVKIGQQNLGVLNHSVPGYLVEGYFHTYQPARHKAMNSGVCRLEGVDYARGVADYFEWTKEITGDIYGVVRDKHEKFTHEYYTPRAGTYDVYKPLNDVTVNLMQGETVLATTTTDDEWNGAFVFNNVAPGDYTLTFSHEDYKADSVWTTDKAVEEVVTSIPVTVKAAVTAYPTAFMESKTYVVPSVVYVNYPDSTAGKSEYVLKNKYKMYNKGEATALSAQLEGKTIRRQIVRDGKMYVLALDIENKANVYIFDIANDKLVKTLGATATVGDILPLSDIALTAEGVLVGINKANQAFGGEKNVTAYKWEIGEDNLPDGEAQVWWTNNFAGNWTNGIAGESVVYDGTLESGKFIYTGTTSATNGNTRLVIADISEGNYIGYKRNNQDGVYVKTSYLGESYKMTLSPNADNQLVFDSEKVLPFEVQMREKDVDTILVVGQMAEDIIPVATNNANYFKYAGKSLMVAPDVVDGKVAGVKMFDITEGLDKAVEVTLNGAALAEPVEATYASAHGELVLTLDELTGNLKKAEMWVYLSVDGKVTKFTATPPAAVNVTPGAGTANPFAYGLSGEVADATLKVNYSLNVAAQAVKVVVMNEEGEVVAEGEAAAEAGAHTAEISLANVATGNYNWGIEVTGDAKTTIAQFQEWGFYHPCGLDVDNSFESPSFGTLLVAEGYTKGKSAADYISVGATEMGGLYMFDAAGNSIKGANGSARFYPTELTFNYTYPGSTTAGADVSKAAFAEDGRIFITRYNDQGDYILTAPSVAALVADGKFTSLFEGMTMTDGIYKDAEGAFVAGPMQSFDVIGGGEDTKLLAMTRTEISTTTGVSLNSIVEYPIGTATTITAPVATVIDKKYTISYDRGANIAYDNNGGIWYCQHRSAPTDENPALVYVDTEGNVQFFEGAGGKERRKGAVAISPDGTKLAAPSAPGYISIYEVETDEASGEVSLIETFVIKAPGNNLYSLAWDAAGNLYAGNATNEWVKGFSVPRGGAFITKAASKYAFEFENSAIESVESEEIDAPAEYYNLQGIKVANPANGIFIKKQGNKATKVVL